MSTTRRAGLRAGVLGLMLGCVPAIWLVGWVAAAEFRTKPNPMRAAPAAGAPPVAPAGGAQSGQSGQQLGQSGAVGRPAVSEAQKELRSLFPFESLAKRLDYETARKSPAEKEPGPRMTAEAEKRLASLEGAIDTKRAGGRTVKLILLHSDAVAQLPSTPVFGMLGGSFGPSAGSSGRSGAFSLTRDELEAPQAQAIPFAAVRGPSSGDGDALPPKRDRLAALHTNGLLDFLDPDGLGYVEDRDHVAGFAPHQFRRTPDFAGPPEGGKKPKAEPWAVVRLELVSLRGRDRPAVYVTDALPSMEAARDAATRPLSPFEEKALKTLRTGDDLATESSGDRIRMLGSLRAGKQCLECHEVKRGDLLGAFSWELQRQPWEGPMP